jgi:hypothetical protein
MAIASPHTFHIPVLGLGYSIDAPVKVAHFGIDSVVSIIQDDLIEKMRSYHSELRQLKFTDVPRTQHDYRAKRVTAYLELLQDIVRKNTEQVKSALFEKGSVIMKYFEMLPENSPHKKLFRDAVSLPARSEERLRLEKILRELVVAGSIDVNIMCKVDNAQYDQNGNRMAPEFSDAHAAFRGFAQSSLSSSVVLSAGYNPSLYNYISTFSDFLPDDEGELKKKVILKVSDWRSARIQATKLAQKGVWVSEFRIESGLNCGGHAFATDGLLLGPILEEFRSGIEKFTEQTTVLCNDVLARNGKSGISSCRRIKLSVQGGFGTSAEHEFVRDYYGVNSVGWGSPFLLVPEVMNVDAHTLSLLGNAKKSDYYLSNSSPLGIPLSSIRNATSTREIAERRMNGKPGSPCYHEYLASDTEFSERPLCTASRAYQKRKLAQLAHTDLSDDERCLIEEDIYAKDCLCEGLSASAYVVAEIKRFKGLKGIAVCPGPNLAYFSGVFTLQEMVDHIYGRRNLTNNNYRPYMFVNELHLYVKYYCERVACTWQCKTRSKPDSFLKNLVAGINYYKNVLADLPLTSIQRTATRVELEEAMSILRLHQNDLMKYGA